jgi:hypothetical protein
MTPALRLAWTAEVNIGEKQDSGAGPLGQRSLVPILGRPTACWRNPHATGKPGG